MAKKVNHNYKPVLEVYRESAQAVRRNLNLFILLAIPTFIDVAWRSGTDLRNSTNHETISSFLSSSVLGSGPSVPNYSTGSTVFVILLTIAGVITSVMSVILVTRAAQRHIVRPGDVWQEFITKWWRILLVELLVGVLIVAGFFALIIPGIIILPRLILAPYLLVDQDTGIIEAVKRSWHLTEGKMVPVYALILFGIVLAVPNFIPVAGPILAFLLTFFYAVAMPIRYMEFKKS